MIPRNIAITVRRKMIMPVAILKKSKLEIEYEAWMDEDSIRGVFSFSSSISSSGMEYQIGVKGAMFAV